MMRVRQLAALLLLVPSAAAQDLPVVRPEFRGLNVSVQQESEVRIELGTTALIPDARVAATYHDSLILDWPGAVYRGVPRRIQVNNAGVRTVRLWMQSEDPALTRVVVEIDRTQQYLLSSDGKTIVLRVGPVLQGVSSSATPNTSDVVGRVNSVPSAAGRATGLGNAANTLAGIFKRGPGKPTIYGNAKIRDVQPVTQADSATQTAQSPNQTQNPSSQTPTAAGASSAQTTEQNRRPIDSSETAKALDAVRASNPPADHLAKADPLYTSQPGTRPVATPFL